MTTETDITTEASSADTDAAAKRDAKNARRRALRAAKRDVTVTKPTVTVTKPTVTKPVAAATIVKEPSKKERTVVIYAEVMKAEGSRKDGIARLTAELNLSPAGASTYWQNCKSGTWS
mgnify:CR=1 FL=1|jgi:hypothetical protein|tara:strand:- start:487 stop:840 length:354 start_codon:yes stop_codon:yes gene_type:complete